MSSDAAGVQPVTMAGTGGVIHDIGYRQYGGQRFGRPQIVRALAIDGGQLLRADTISSVTQASSVLLIEVDDGTEELQAELARRGLAAVAYQRGLLLEVSGPEAYDTIRDAIADLGLPLTRLEQRRHRLEELFRADPSLTDMTGAISVQ